jgi:OOP family OmpA-OmpF porin
MFYICYANKSIMKLIKLSLLLFIFITSTFYSSAQNAENPWAISVGIDLINVQGGDIDSGLNFGAPALSLSRYLGVGFSLGAQYSLNNIKNTPEDLGYSSIDGVVKYNLSDGKISPYLFAGFGVSRFSTNADNEGLLPSKETSRTGLGGIGVNFDLNDKLAINVSASYRSDIEGDGYNHLQHIVGLSYSFGAGDADKDGVSDEKDECPDVPGLKEFNGCPDSDGDGIPDNKDRCPEEAGTEALQGCPDGDGDGVADIDDICPDIAGMAEMNGCPDTDSDGVSDNEDKCPEIAGDIANGGCPWADTDGDGVLDNIDACKDEKGTIVNNGCPELSKEILATLNKFGLRINFPANSDKILGKKTQNILYQIKELLEEYPGDILIVEGYASSDGDDAYNIELSIKRAQAVKAYLVKIGVSKDRLEVRGLGEAEPISNNESKEGRAENRRVQFLPKLKVLFLQ